MAQTLEGKIAIITGAGSGMGLATARRFHAEGARLVVTDISGAETKTAEELGDRVIAVNADVSKAEDAKKIIQTAIHGYGGLDILANVAGAIAPMVPLDETPDTDFDKMVNVNLRSVFLLMKAAVPHLVERGGGSIVNIASTAAFIGTPNLAAYGGAKSGVLGLTRSGALEYGARGIRVNAILPGTIQTPMMDQGAADDPSVGQRLAAMVPMGRTGQAEEIAAAVLFLASDESSYINGVALPVDGGQTAG